MQKSNKILNVVSWCFLIPYVLFVMLAFTLPMFTVESSSSSASSYLIWLVSIGTYTSSSTASINSFYGVLLVIMGLVGGFLLISKNDIARHVGEGMTVGFLTGSIYLLKMANWVFDTLEEYSSSSSYGSTENYSKGPALALLVVAIVFGFLYFFFALIANYGSASIQKISDRLHESQRPQKTIEEQLNEIEKLKEKKLITEEEASRMKSDVLFKGTYRR